MARTFLLDQYLAEIPQSEVEARANWAVDTYQFYGLTPETAVIFGSCALDMYGIDCRAPRYDGNRSSITDLDVVVTPAVVDRLRSEYPLYYADDDISFYSYERPHPNYFGGTEERPIDAIALMYREDKHKVDFEIASANSQIVTVYERVGCAVLRPEVALEWTLSGRTSKDVFRVLYAHASARRQELSIANTPEWQDTVRRAVAKSLDENFQYRTGSYTPNWITDLQAGSRCISSHPAFEFLDEQS